MNKYISFSILALSLVLFSKCATFLDEEAKTKYSSDYIYGTPEGLSMAVNALYTLQRYYTNDTESATHFALTRATDESVTNGGTGNFYGIYDPNYLKPSASQIGFMWKTMYQIIGKANDIIDAGMKMEATAISKQAIAEARCFRAQSYFLLYRTFDRIWLNTQPTTPENVNNPRDYHPSTEKEVFDLIYSDLNYAIKNLSWTTDEPGRFTQGAARHIKAKAGLWIKDWQTTINQVDSIDQTGRFKLIALDKIFNAADLNHEEAILVQQWSKNPGGNLSNASPAGNYFSAYFIAPYRIEIGGTAEYACSYINWGYTYGRIYPSPYLFSLYDKVKDKRFTTFYIHNYINTTISDIKYGTVTVKPGDIFPQYKSGVFNKNVYPGCLKFGDIWTRAPFETTGYKDVIVYRLAETYIMGAEAYLNTGNQVKAKYYYNKTWQRAGNDAFTATLSFKEIRDEQARELALEGDRWYFLKRNGILLDQIQKYSGDPLIAATILGRKNLPANPHFVRWPIPETEIINMGADKFPQNVGYK